MYKLLLSRMLKSAIMIDKYRMNLSSKKEMKEFSLCRSLRHPLHTIYIIFPRKLADPFYFRDKLTRSFRVPVYLKLKILVLYEYEAFIVNARLSEKIPFEIQ